MGIAPQSIAACDEAIAMQDALGRCVRSRYKGTDGFRQAGDPLKQSIDAWLEGGASAEVGAKLAGFLRRARRFARRRARLPRLPYHRAKCCSVTPNTSVLERAAISRSLARAPFERATFSIAR